MTFTISDLSSFWATYSDKSFYDTEYKETESDHFLLWEGLISVKIVNSLWYNLEKMFPIFCDKKKKEFIVKKNYHWLFLIEITISFEQISYEQNLLGLLCFIFLHFHYPFLSEIVAAKKSVTISMDQSTKGLSSILCQDGKIEKVTLVFLQK